MKKRLTSLSFVFCTLVFMGCSPALPTQSLQAAIQKPTGTPIAVQTLPPPETSPTPGNTRAALEAIKGYLQRQVIEYQYLGEDVNLNYPQQRVARYRVDWSEFSVELQTNHIVVIDNQNVLAQPGPAGQHSPQTLEQMAKDLIARLAPNVDVETLTPEYANKGDNYFFRWVDSAREGDPFIQVGYNVEGNLLNYINGLGIE